MVHFKPVNALKNPSGISKFPHHMVHFKLNYEIWIYKENICFHTTWYILNETLEYDYILTLEVFPHHMVHFKLRIEIRNEEVSNGVSTPHGTF